MSERFVAVVIDVNDPEQAGRVRIRVYGLHDDTSRVPDSALPWARCIFPVTNPIHDGVAGPTTGLVPGSTVVGYFVDDANQVALVDGVVGRSADGDSDFPQSDRGEDHNSVIGDSILHIGVAELKNVEARTIGAIQYVGQSVNSMMAEIGEGNIAGALSHLRNGIDQFNQIRRFITESPVEQLNSVIAGFASDFGSIIDEELDEVITTDLGNVIESVSIPGTTSGSNLLQQINTATGVLFTTSNHFSSAIGNRTSKRVINNAQDALNRVNGHRFVMRNVMGQLDSTLSRLRIQQNRND